MMAAFDYYKSAGNVYDVDAVTINASEESIRELSAKTPEEIIPEVSARQEDASLLSRKMIRRTRKHFSSH